MHEHSDKIQPKKLMVTIFFTILLIVFAFILRKNNTRVEKPNIPMEATSTIN